MYDFSDIQLTPITKEAILLKISEYDIFKYYIPAFIGVNKVFCSDLRDDGKPSCCIQVWQNKLFYKDFATGESCDAFGYVQKKFGCNFHESLRIIGADFGLLQQSKRSMDRKPIIHPKMSLIASNTEIEPNIRPWRIQDVEYWGKYGISIEILEKYNVKPCKYVFVRNNRFDEKLNSPIYSYQFKDKYKIYRPLEEKFRWMSNTSALNIQGWQQLPEKGDVCIISKSLKDVMTYNSLGISAIAPQSESTDIPEYIINNLKTRFKQVIINFDPDLTGVIYSQKLSIKYNILYFFIDDAKDVSDLYSLKGREETIKQIQDKILSLQ